jgi:hypothetical protein
MEMANVPTMAALRDTSTYRCESGIPVFRPHVRYVLDINRTPTDKVKYKVTDEDLEEICRNSNAVVEKDCHFPRHTIGHVDFSAKPEHAQPAKYIGHAVNYRVGLMPNHEKVVLADLYTHRDHWEESRKFPYRSAEYNWKSKKIGGVARVLRDPALGLGTTTYEDESSYTCYAEPMMDKPGEAPTAGGGKTPVSQHPSPATPPGMNMGDLNPDEAVLADRLWAYYAAKNPGLSSLQAAPSGTNGGLPETDQKPEPEENEEGAAAKAGKGEEEDDENEEGEGRTPPAKKKKKPSEDDDVSKNENAPTVEAYAALEGEVKTLREENAKLKADGEKGKVAAILAQLSDVEKYEFDADDEMTLMLPLDAAGRKVRADKIRKNSKKKDDETVVVLEGNAGTEQLPGTQVASGMSAERYAKVMKHYQANLKTNGTWADALAAVPR